MKFIENKISTSRSTSWADYVKKVTAPKTETVVKTASVKVAEEEKKETKKENKDEGKSSGQLDVEPLHQKGESVKPSAITEENKKTCATAEAPVKVAEEKKEIKKDDIVTYDAGKTEAKLTNDPKPLEEKKESAAKTEVKKAEKEEKEEKTEDKKEDKKEDKSDDKEDGLTPGQRKLPPALQEAIKNKKSLAEVKFVKISNLTDKAKTELVEYYKKFWSQDFAEALTADK